MDNQRLRNLTTGYLHTCIEDIHLDVEFILGKNDSMLYALPIAMIALREWLKEKVTDKRFWNFEYDTTHKGETQLNPMTVGEKVEFWNRYKKLLTPKETNAIS